MWADIIVNVQVAQPPVLRVTKLLGRIRELLDSRGSFKEKQ
jgi:hypothetical protein